MFFVASNFLEIFKKKIINIEVSLKYQSYATYLSNSKRAVKAITQLIGNCFRLLQYIHVYNLENKRKTFALTTDIISSILGLIYDDLH